MSETLRPLTLAEILDRTAQFYRSRFLVFLGISTIPSGTIFVFAAGIFAFIAWMGSNSRNGGSVADVFVWVFLILLGILVAPVSMGVSALGAAAMSDAAARIFLGEAITIRSAYKNVWRRGWRYVGLYILQGLVIVVAPMIAFVAGVVVMVLGKVSGYAVGDNSPLFGGLVFLLLVVLAAFAVWMLLRLCLAFPTCVVEQTTAWNALKRGTRLGHGTQGRMLVLYILGLILNWMLTWPVSIVVIIAVTLIPSFQGQKHSQAVGMIVMFTLYGSYFAVKALVKPIYGIGLTIFYFDQRIRKEGFDIEWMMHQAGMVPAAEPAPAPESASAPELQPVAAALPEPVIAVPVIDVPVETVSVEAVQIEAGQVETELSQAFPAREQDLAGAPGEAKA